MFWPKAVHMKRQQFKATGDDLAENKYYCRIIFLKPEQYTKQAPNSGVVHKTF